VQIILYHYVLWAELSGTQLLIHYADRLSKNRVTPAVLTFDTGSSNPNEIEGWIRTLLNRAYGSARRRQRIKVLINPFGGQGKAQKYWTRDIEPIFQAARCEYNAETTLRMKHAVEIAEELDVERWDVVACCSGDGLPYEVFNGLARKKNARHALAKLAVVQLPCGSGNAMSLNLNGTDSPSMAALAMIKGLRTPLDLISITQGDERTISFLSQSVGIVAECDLGTDNIRWMGSARFTYGFFVRLLGKTVWPCDIAVGVELEDKNTIKDAYRHYVSDNSSNNAKTTSSSSSEVDGVIEHDSEGLPPLRYGTIKDPLPPTWIPTPYPNLGNFYAGNMAYMSADTNFFPATLPSDGCLDLITIDGDIPFTMSIKLMEAAAKGQIFNHELVTYRKVSGYRIVPREKEGYISIDGERIPFEGFQAEVHRGLGCTLSRTGRIYEAQGP
jgi:sphingosine kinase